MKVDSTRFLRDALIVSCLCNALLFGAWRAERGKISKLQSQSPVQQESWVAPLQRPMKVYNTTVKTNQP